MPLRMGRRHSHRTKRHTIAYMFVSRLAMMIIMAMALMMVLIMIVMMIVAMAMASDCKL